MAALWRMELSHMKILDHPIIHLTQSMWRKASCPNLISGINFKKLLSVHYCLFLGNGVKNTGRFNVTDFSVILTF